MWSAAARDRGFLYRYIQDTEEHSPIRIITYRYCSGCWGDSLLHQYTVTALLPYPIGLPVNPEPGAGRMQLKRLVPEQSTALVGVVGRVVSAAEGHFLQISNCLPGPDSAGKKIIPYQILAADPNDFQRALYWAEGYILHRLAIAVGT